MFSAWQSCMGDYKPEQIFVRNDCTVITKDVMQIADEETGTLLWKWQEYAMPTRDFDNIADYFDKAQAADILLGNVEVEE